VRHIYIRLIMYASYYSILIIYIYMYVCVYMYIFHIYISIYKHACEQRGELTRGGKGGALPSLIERVRRGTRCIIKYIKIYVLRIYILVYIYVYVYIYIYMHGSRGASARGRGMGGVLPSLIELARRGVR